MMLIASNQKIEASAVNIKELSIAQNLISYGLCFCPLARSQTAIMAEVWFGGVAKNSPKKMLLITPNMGGACAFGLVSDVF